jgi:DNA-binding SARP family transcriptional activator
MNSALTSASGSQGRAQWSLRLLGGFELASPPGGERLGLPGKRERLLLAYLALSPNGRASRRKLTSLLWEETAEEAALHSLRNCLSVLRKALSDAQHRTLSSQGEDIVLDLSAFDTDVLAFRRLAAHPGRTELEAAAELCSGDLLEGLSIDGEEFESWRRTEATCHRDQWVDVLSRLMGQFEDAGETERAIETGTRILGFEPLHEGVVRRLMRLYGRSGRRGVAIGVYHSLAASLRGEVGAPG